MIQMLSESACMFCTDSRNSTLILALQVIINQWDGVIGYTAQWAFIPHCLSVAKLAIDIKSIEPSTAGFPLLS